MERNFCIITLRHVALLGMTDARETLPSFEQYSPNYVLFLACCVQENICMFWTITGNVPQALTLFLHNVFWWHYKNGSVCHTCQRAQIIFFLNANTLDVQLSPLVHVMVSHCRHELIKWYMSYVAFLALSGENDLETTLSVLSIMKSTRM
jgi:hypothetical protein